MFLLGMIMKHAERNEAHSLFKNDWGIDTSSSKRLERCALHIFGCKTKNGTVFMWVGKGISKHHCVLVYFYIHIT